MGDASESIGFLVAELGELRVNSVEEFSELGFIDSFGIVIVLLFGYVKVGSPKNLHLVLYKVQTMYFFFLRDDVLYRYVIWRHIKVVSVGLLPDFFRFNIFSPLLSKVLGDLIARVKEHVVVVVGVKHVRIAQELGVPFKDVETTLARFEIAWLPLLVITHTGVIRMSPLPFLSSLNFIHLTIVVGSVQLKLVGFKVLHRGYCGHIICYVWLLRRGEMNAHARHVFGKVGFVIYSHPGSVYFL